MEFKNPENGYVEEKSLPWLWTLIFGGLYFLASGAWGHFVLWVILSSTFLLSLGPGGILLVLIMNFAYMLFADSIISGKYLRDGWIRIDDESDEPEPDAAKGQVSEVRGDERLCPFCAETIKSRAVYCRFCQRDIPAQDCG